jgi:hypothetical protein
MQTQLPRSRLLASIPNVLLSGANRLLGERPAHIGSKNFAAEIDAAPVGGAIHSIKSERIPFPHE